MIPNVSSIYRDLATMADPYPFRNNMLAPSLSRSDNPYSEKQQRHNQLMERLRNAQREASSINSQLDNTPGEAALHRKELSYQSYRLSYESDNRCETLFFSQMERDQGVGRGWQPPKIRYRHIEDFKPVNPVVPLAEINRESMPKTPLERQFYDQPVEEEIKGGKKENGTNVQASYRDKSRGSEVEKVEKRSEASYGHTWMHKESKFQDKLESYYQLCKKRPVSTKVQQNPAAGISRAKFQRTNGNKPIGLDLQKAIKMLSID